MAKIKDPIFSKASGRFGNFVIRRTVHGTILSSFPAKRRTPVTGREIKLRQRFADAAVYAKTINSDPEKKAAYAAQFPNEKSVYRHAFKTYMAQFKPDAPAFISWQLPEKKPAEKTIYRNDKTGRFISEKKYRKADPAKVIKEKVPINKQNNK